MLGLQEYGSSSDSDLEDSDKLIHLKPVDISSSVAKTLSVVAAPDVVPMVSFICFLFKAKLISIKHLTLYKMKNHF